MRRGETAEDEGDRKILKNVKKRAAARKMLRRVVRASGSPQTNRPCQVLNRPSGLGGVRRHSVERAFSAGVHP